ncbi:MAG: hypothetical protein VX730_03350 [Pseudomonadota bacterium]|nr:hypothetical protein [Pseudomonadota bacterium]
MAFEGNKEFYEDDLEQTPLGSHCLVCGNNMHDELTTDAWQSICHCCGAQVGYTYPVVAPSIAEVVEYRHYWLNKKDGQWDYSEHQPVGWTKEKALEQIKANVPKEFQ